MTYLLPGLLLGIPIFVLLARWAMAPAPVSSASESDEDMVLLFRGGVLEDASPAALETLPLLIGLSDWDDLRSLLLPGLRRFPARPPRHRELQLKPHQGGRSAVLSPVGQAIRVHLYPEHLTRAPAPGSQAEDADLTNALANCLPFPAWHIDTAGRIDWCNPAFQQLRDRMSSPQTGQAALSDPTELDQKHRIFIAVKDRDVPDCFEIHRRDTPEGTFHFALSQNALMQAENARRNFVQTLSKTFADLPIGLAIFNSDRQLVLFNPALLDLTGLGIPFLGPKPTLDSFFDALRENRRMPEPKDYDSWRRRICDMISAAQGDGFTETWTLESGQTLRVKGQPHPEGALAFLITDISAEVSLTRTFQAELELGQSLLDTFEDALAVFSQQGVLTFSNRAYDTLWGVSADTSFADVTITDALHHWRDRCAAGPDWHEIVDTVLSFGDRAPRTLEIGLRQGGTLSCHIVPITAGATLIRFTNTAAAPRKLLPAQ